jgi:hypothetical protein
LHSLHVNDDDDDYDENAQGCKAFTAVQASTALPGFYKRIQSPPTNLLLFYISKHNHNHNTSSSSSSSSSINIHSDNIQSIQSTQAPLLSIIPQHPDS